MSLVVSALILLYEYGICPLLLGTLWWKRSEKASASKMYVQGYMSMFALFLVCAVPAIRIGYGIHELADIWKIATLAAGGICVVRILLLLRRMSKEKMLELKDNVGVWQRKLYPMFLIFLVALLLSAVFVLPSKQDDTAETVSIAMKAGAMYRYEPYSLTEGTAKVAEKLISPLEALYVASAAATSLDALMVLHLILPFFMLPFFFAVCWRVGRFFCKNDLEKCSLMVAFLLIFYSVACYTEVIPAMGPFQNIWNAQTLFVSCGMPVMLIWCLERIEAWKQKDLFYPLDWIFGIVILFANQLMMPDGAFISVLVLGICIGICVMGKVIAYGFSIRKHKE